MRASVLALPLFAACATSGPTRWKGFEELRTRPDVGELERKKDDGKLREIVQKGAWFWAGGLKEGPFVDVEWFGKDFIVAKPDWGNAKTPDEQTALIQTKVVGCPASLFRQLRGFDYSSGALPGREQLCWTEQKNLLITRNAEGRYERLLWSPSTEFSPMDMKPIPAEAPLSARTRPLCEGCNAGPGGAFYILDSALESWRDKRPFDAMRQEQEEVFIGNFDWLGIDAAEKKAREETQAAADALERERQAKLAAERATIQRSLDALAALEKQHLSRRLAEYKRLSTAAADVVRFGGANERFTERFLAIDEAMSDAVEAALEKAEHDQRVATAAYLRLVSDRLKALELPGRVSVDVALEGGDTSIMKSRRELARLAVSLLPTFSGAVEFADGAYASGALLDYTVHLEATDLAEVAGAHHPWKLELSTPTRGGRACSQDVAMTLNWQQKLGRLLERIELHRAALSTLKKLLKQKKISWTQEKVTIGSGVYAVALTIDKRSDPGLSTSQATSPDLQQIADHETHIEALLEEYRQMSMRAPQGATRQLKGSGPLERTVRLTIEGETKTYAQAVQDSAEECLSPAGFGHLTRELGGILQRELRGFVEKQIAARLELYGHIWNAADRDFEVRLLRSIYIERDKSIDSPLDFRSLVPTP